MRKETALFIIAILVIILSGCGEEEELELVAEIRFNIQIPSLAPFGAISTITVTVTADDKTVLATASLTIQDNTATGRVTVLAGKNRVFTLEAKDKDGALIGSGTATADVIAGETITVEITIIPTKEGTGDVIVIGKWDGEPPEGIIPGVGAAGIKLGEPFSKAKELGEPILDPKYPMTFGMTFVYGEVVLLGVVNDLNKNQVIDDNEPIILIIVAAPYNGKTAGGNGIGSLLADVEREFGAADTVTIDKANNIELHDYPKKGIEFTYDLATRKVVIVTIYEPIKGAPSLKGNLKPFQQFRQLRRGR